LGTRSGSRSLGPPINRRQVDRVSAIVDEAVDGGADLVSGGPGGGLFYKPTVLTDVSTDMRAYREDVFGPVAPS
jgi:benzaldehyde dehydrogenase (NAD)